MFSKSYTKIGLFLKSDEEIEGAYESYNLLISKLLGGGQVMAFGEIANAMYIFTHKHTHTGTHTYTHKHTRSLFPLLSLYRSLNFSLLLPLSLFFALVFSHTYTLALAHTHIHTRTHLCFCSSHIYAGESHALIGEKYRQRDK